MLGPAGPQIVREGRRDAVGRERAGGEGMGSRNRSRSQPRPKELRPRESGQGLALFPPHPGRTMNSTQTEEARLTGAANAGHGSATSTERTWPANWSMRLDPSTRLMVRWRSRSDHGAEFTHWADSFGANDGGPG